MTRKFNFDPVVIIFLRLPPSQLCRPSLAILFRCFYWLAPQWILLGQVIRAIDNFSSSKRTTLKRPANIAPQLIESFRKSFPPVKTEVARALSRATVYSF